MHIAPATPRARDITTTNDVGVLVRRFYIAAIPDPLLGPVFETFGVDWAEHIPKLTRYWISVLVSGEPQARNTVAAHAPVQRAAPFGDAHVARWVELWEETVDELFVGPTAERAKARARQVGHALRAVAARQQEGPPDGPAD
jgi:hemoglobin